MDYRDVLEKLLSGDELHVDEAQWFMRSAMSGELSDVKLTALLVALQAKGATGAELAAFAEVMRTNMVSIGELDDHVVDTCGTGGGAPSFNISTAAAIVASAAGAKVAKHGNRAVTSTCGSADVLESLGVRLGSEPEHLLHQLETIGLVFLFAPHLHPGLKAVGAVRRELQVRTVFNQLGPLANPARAKRQVIGVFAESLLRPVAEALQLLGAKKALIVHGHDGLDEVSPCAPTHACLVEHGTVESLTLDASSFGIDFVSTTDIQPGDTVESNAAILREAISDPSSPRSRAILPSAGTAIWISGHADDLRDGVEMAYESIKSGQASRQLDKLIEASQSA